MNIGLVNSVFLFLQGVEKIWKCPFAFGCAVAVWKSHPAHTLATFFEKLVLTHFPEREVSTTFFTQIWPEWHLSGWMRLGIKFIIIISYPY